ncbi:hypothetical protein [uncultured Campylobacter sp.]|uniref:hypothetical protein n=1 Tax=uncultured Campylobacter sp. TaxID=218934 RepID=UPI00261F22F2|nr:hypothetical protein [uncultured Campylobacter sp.]
MLGIYFLIYRNALNSMIVHLKTLRNSIQWDGILHNATGYVMKVYHVSIPSGIENSTSSLAFLCGCRP